MCMSRKPQCFELEINRFPNISRTGELAVHVLTVRHNGVKSFVKPARYTLVAFKQHNIGRERKSRHTTNCAVYHVEEEKLLRIESRSCRMRPIKLFGIP